MGFKFLSNEWFAEVDKLREAAGELDVPAALADLSVNIKVATDGGDVALHIKSGNFYMGEDGDAETTVSLPSDLARKIFIDNDMAAGMQGFMSGQIKVDGDVTKLMALQTTQPSDKQKALGKQIQEITE